MEAIWPRPARRAAWAALLLVVAVLVACLVPLPAPENPCIMTFSRPNYELVELPSRLRYKYRLFRFWDEQLGKQGHLPFLFVPGNRGSFEQVRSIAHELNASMATYTIDFQSEFVGGSGVHLSHQSEFLTNVLMHLRDLYPDRRAIVVAHSMGGVAAMSNSRVIDNLILMSTPLARPVVMADATMRDVYSFVHRGSHDNLVVASIAGGARDRLVAPELTVVDPRLVPVNRTVHALARELGGSLGTSADHDAIVWCNQVVKAVANAVLAAAAAVNDRGDPAQRRMAMARALLGEDANETRIAQARKRVVLGESPLGVPSNVPQSVRKAINVVRAGWPRIFPALAGVAVMRLARSSPSLSKDDDASRVEAKLSGTGGFVPTHWLNGAFVGVGPAAAGVLCVVAAAGWAQHGVAAVLYVAAAETAALAASWALWRIAKPLPLGFLTPVVGCGVAVVVAVRANPPLGAQVFALAAAFACVFVAALGLALVLPCTASRKGDRFGFVVALALSVLFALPAMLPHALVAAEFLVGGPAHKQWARELPVVRGRAHALASSPVDWQLGEPNIFDYGELWCAVVVLSLASYVLWQATRFAAGRDAIVEGKWGTTVRRAPEPRGTPLMLESDAPSATARQSKVESSMRAVTLPDGTADFVELLPDLKYVGVPELVKLSSGEIVQIDTLAAADAVGPAKLATAEELRFGADVNLSERAGRYVGRVTGPWSDASLAQWARWVLWVVGAWEAFVAGEEMVLVVLGAALAAVLKGRLPNEGEERIVVV